MILLALGMTFYLSDISYNTGTLFNAFGILGLLVGSILWISGWLYDVGNNRGIYIWLFLGLIVLGLLILSAFAI